MATTFRTRMVAGFGTMMASYITSNPALLKRHFRVRPPSFGTDLPCSYLDLRPETVEYTSGTQVRTASPSLVVVDRLTDNGETMDRFDVLVDSLVQFIGGYGGSFGGHITPDTVWSQMTIADIAEEDGDSHFAAARFAFPDLSLVEGRPSLKAAYVNPLTATPEAIVNALHLIGLITQVKSVTATPETIVYALESSGLLVGVLNPLTATAEQIANALITAKLMEPS